MPNKRDPNRDIDEFHEALEALRQVWTQTNIALLGTPGVGPAERERLAKESCADAFLRAAVAFEGFRSDWHITAVHRDSSQFTQFLEERVQQRLSGDSMTEEASAYVSVTVPRHLSLATARRLLDAQGRNLSLRPDSKRSWGDRAERELNGDYQAVVKGLRSADQKLIEAVDALRNHLAHRSRDSVDRMNSALLALDGHVDQSLRIAGNYKVQETGVPRYLWARTQGDNGPRRLETYFDRMDAVAEALRVE